MKEETRRGNFYNPAGDFITKRIKEGIKEYQMHFQRNSHYGAVTQNYENIGYFLRNKVESRGNCGGE